MKSTSSFQYILLISHKCDWHTEDVHEEIFCMFDLGSYWPAPDNFGGGGGGGGVY